MSEYSEVGGLSCVFKFCILCTGFLSDWVSVPLLLKSPFNGTVKIACIVGMFNASLQYPWFVTLSIRCKTLIAGIFLWVVRTGLPKGQILTTPQMRLTMTVEWALSSAGSDVIVIEEISNWMALETMIILGVPAVRKPRETVRYCWLITASIRNGK